MYNKYFTMKRSELKEAIKSEIKSVLSENRYDINDPNSPMGKLNDEYESSGLKGIVDKYGLDVVLMMLSSGEYGDRLNESVLTEEIQVGDIVTLGGDGDELEVIDSREMFGSDMMAYRVKFPDGNTEEYSADQLRPARMMNEGENYIDDTKPTKFLSKDELAAAIKRGDYEPSVMDKIASFLTGVKEDSLKEGKRGVVVDPDEIMMHINQYQRGNIDGDDLAQAIEEILVAMMSTPLNEEDEPTAADLKKKDSVATISNKLQKLTAKMKKKAKEFKEAEGKAKDKIKDELKDMTAEKKKLEKDL